MTKYRVHLHTVMSMSIEVEVDDADMSPEDARDRAVDQAYDEMPGDICAQCSGWRQPWSRDLGEWEIDADEPMAPAVVKVEGSDR